MKIGILGGRFDPPHIGHFWVIKQTLEAFNFLDQTWLMPCNRHVWKETVASPEERLAMSKFFAQKDDRIIVSDLEIRRGGVSYTIETVKKLKEDKDNEYFWIVGSDAISDFSKWHSNARLSRLIKFLVFPRIDYPVKFVPPGFRLINNKDFFVTNLSSTMIRERIKKNLPITGLVLPEIEEYIYKKGLYL